MFGWSRVLELPSPLCAHMSLVFPGPLQTARFRHAAHSKPQPSSQAQGVCGELARRTSDPLRRDRYFVSINRELKPLLHVLRHEYRGIQGYTPTNIQGVHEIGPHLLAFSQKWKAEGCPPLLACTLDVERAFDTVNQDRCVWLLRICARR